MSATPVRVSPVIPEGNAGQSVLNEGERVIYCSQPSKNVQYPDNSLRTTKYTLLTFLPKNLLEQFSRHINRYFLLIACLQLFSIITPVSPVTTWAPLIAVFGLSAAKELLDDLGRAKQDKEANEKLYKVFRDGCLLDVKSRDIRVGDIIKLHDGEQVPCDVCILQSSSPDGACMVQTMNLDGETTLKIRMAVPSLQKLPAQEIENYKGVITCGLPDASVYRFDSRIGSTSLSGSQLIQQTTTIKNTTFIYGATVYTGSDTKFAQNRGAILVKWTKSDAFINKVAIALFLFQIMLVIIFGTVGNVWEATAGSNHPYLGYKIDAPDSTFARILLIFIIPLRFLLLNSTIIPISLKVTLDVCKFYYAKFIGWDHKLFLEDDVDHESSYFELQPARANNSAISEDLGQIQYVLTDKTGTLTENEMVFRKCSIKGTLFSERDCGAGGRLFMAGEHNESSVTLDFLRNLALNSTAVPARDANQRIVYKSSSPDEESLVDAAAQLGVQLISRQGPLIELLVHGHTEFYVVRQELSFTSERRRMSVVVQDRATNKLILYCKGGDDVIMERVVNHSADDQLTIAHLNSFAGEGLRTLAFAQKTLDSAKYAAWVEKFNVANTAVDNREDALALVYEELEQGLGLIGASAIEDRLQKDVPETIQSLRAGGVKFWMLTGDKFSTALQIATSCNLKSSLSENSVLLEINSFNEADVSNELSSHRQILETHRETRDICIILRGASLTAAMSMRNQTRFLELCMSASSVICCRFSPRQKAQVVKMVKDAGLMTLAIGDGGNDVSMIMEAHVGVGIRGKEGLQAARASDFQVNHFRSLKPLLLVHGRQSYLRTSLVAQYSFFKSFEFCFIQIAFGFSSGFSGSALFNSACIAAYNALLFIPILTFILDQDLSSEQALRFPEAYLDCQTGRHFTWRTYVIWMIRAFFQAIVVYLLSIAIYDVGFLHHQNGDPAGLEALGLLAFFSFLLIQSLTMILEQNYVTLLHLMGIIGFHFFGMALLYACSTSVAFDSLIGLGSVEFVFTDPVFWAAQILITACAILPVMAVQVIHPKTLFVPLDIHNYNDSTANDSDTELDSTPILSRPVVRNATGIASASRSGG